MPIRLLDVAGLIPGASEGRGLGCKFLDDLRVADVLLHIIDVSGTTNEKARICCCCCCCCSGFCRSPGGAAKAAGSTPRRLLLLLLCC